MSSRTSEMFEFNKMIFIYLIATIVFGLWSIYYILRRPHLYLSKILFIPLFLFFLILLVSSYVSLDFHTSLYGYYGRWNGGLISILAYGVLLFVFVQIFTKEHVHNLLKISLVSSTIVMLWGYFAKFGIDFSCFLFVQQLSNTCWTSQFQPAVRMFSTIGQPNWLGSYLAIHFFIGLYFFIRSYPLLKDHESIVEKITHILSKLHLVKESHPFGHHIWYAIYLVLNFIAIYFTKSRSSLLSIGFMLSVGFILVATRRIKSHMKPIIRFGAIFLLLLATTFIVNSQSLTLSEKSPEDLAVTDSFEIRKIVWKGAIKLGNQYPWFGTGPETFAYSYFFTKPAEHSNTSEWDFVYNKAHNEYLNYLATTGYIGLLGYMAFLGSAGLIFISFAKKYHADEQVIFMLALGYGTILITNFFGFSTSTIQLFLFLIPAMVVVFNQKEPVDIEIEDIHNSTLQSKLIIVGIIVSSVLCVSYLQRYHKADRLFKQAKDQIYQDEYQKAVLLLTRAIKLKYEHVYEDQLSSSLAHLAFISSFGEDGRTRSLNLLKLSNDANAHTLRKTPKNIQYWKTRAKNHYLYFQLSRDVSDLEVSAESMEHVISLAPTDAQSYYMRALFYSLLFQETGSTEYSEKAMQSVEKSLKLRTNYIEARELRDQLLQ